MNDVKTVTRYTTSARVSSHLFKCSSCNNTFNKCVHQSAASKKKKKKKQQENNVIIMLSTLKCMSDKKKKKN